MKTRLSVSAYGLTLTEAKDYVKVEASNTLEDSMLLNLCTASYEQVTSMCNRDFCQTTYSQTIVSSSYSFITSQNVDAVSTGSLFNNDDGAYIQFDDLYSGTYTYTVSTGSLVVPGNVKVAQMMLLALWYDERNPYIVGRAVKIDYAIEQLLYPYTLIKP